MDGKPNRRDESTFSYFSSVVWRGPETHLLEFQLLP